MEPFSGKLPPVLRYKPRRVNKEFILNCMVLSKGFLLPQTALPFSVSHFPSTALADV